MYAQACYCLFWLWASSARAPHRARRAEQRFQGALLRWRHLGGGRPQRLSSAGRRRGARCCACKGTWTWLSRNHLRPPCDGPLRPQNFCGLQMVWGRQGQLIAPLQHTSAEQNSCIHRALPRTAVHRQAQAVTLGKSKFVHQIPNMS